MAKESSSNGLEKRPKLRFPGFHEPYKKCRIGDIYAERSQRGASDMELLSVTMNDGVMPRSEIEGKDNSSEDKSNYKVVLTGDMVYNSMRMWQGANGIAPCDGIVSPAYTVLMPKIPISNGYFAALFKSTNLINEFRKNSQGMTSDTWNLKYPQIETIKVCIPTLSEQERIADMLGTLEQRIAKQAQLVDSLKKYKRGVVQKFFSEMDMMQWELVQLKDVVSIFDGTHQTPNYKTTGVRFISVENILNPLATQKYISEEDYRKEFKAHPEYGDVLMTRIGDIGRTCYVDFDSDMAYYVSLALFKCSSKIDGRFLAAYISTNSFQKELWERTLHIAFPKKINTGEIGECYIHLPNRERQIAIASYLDVIEKKIQLAEKQLNLMQITKAGLMQQLFI